MTEKTQTARHARPQNSFLREEDAVKVAKRKAAREHSHQNNYADKDFIGGRHAGLDRSVVAKSIAAHVVPPPPPPPETNSENETAQSKAAKRDYSHIPPGQTAEIILCGRHMGKDLTKTAERPNVQKPYRSPVVPLNYSYREEPKKRGIKAFFARLFGKR